MKLIPDPDHNTKLNDTDDGPDDGPDETIWTPATIRLLALNFVLLLLIVLGLGAVFVGLGHGFWVQIGKVFF